MTVRKNPDWTVWLADVWHWARQPPGIYICVIVLLGTSLWYSLSGPTTRITWSPPQTAAPAPRISQSTTDCLPGYVYIYAQGKCFPAVNSQVPQPISPPGYCDDPSLTYDPVTKRCITVRPGFRNNCPIDYLFINRLNACVWLNTNNTNLQNPHWHITRDDTFVLSGVPTTTITVESGNLLFSDNQTGRDTFYGPGSVIEAFGPDTTTVTGVAETSRLRIHFQ